ncbi:hypothetical protein E2C01_009251 [Portunus trituberculatus]|uniref:Uncharacterized protein n=1 Tax=Portunus trituberculatus TaxID=210409 RepID=A0A5B7D4D3_PORTR|nr:hypothetical protein [Portunus trituberculatus]
MFISQPPKPLQDVRVSETRHFYSRNMSRCREWQWNVGLYFNCHIAAIAHQASLHDLCDRWQETSGRTQSTVDFKVPTTLAEAGYHAVAHTAAGGVRRTAPAGCISAESFRAAEPFFAFPFPSDLRRNLEKKLGDCDGDGVVTMLRDEEDIWDEVEEPESSRILTPDSKLATTLLSPHTLIIGPKLTTDAMTVDNSSKLVCWTLPANSPRPPRGLATKWAI